MSHRDLPATLPEDVGCNILDFLSIKEVLRLRQSAAKLPLRLRSIVKSHSAQKGITKRWKTHKDHEEVVLFADKKVHETSKRALAIMQKHLKEIATVSNTLPTHYQVSFKQQEQRVAMLLEQGETVEDVERNMREQVMSQHLLVGRPVAFRTRLAYHKPSDYGPRGGIWHRPILQGKYLRFQTGEDLFDNHHRMWMVYDILDDIQYKIGTSLRGGHRNPLVLTDRLACGVHRDGFFVCQLDELNIENFEVRQGAPELSRSMQATKWKHRCGSFAHSFGRTFDADHDIAAAGDKNTLAFLCNLREQDEQARLILYKHKGLVEDIRLDLQITEWDSKTNDWRGDGVVPFGLQINEDRKIVDVVVINSEYTDNHDLLWVRRYNFDGTFMSEWSVSYHVDDKKFGSLSRHGTWKDLMIVSTGSEEKLIKVRSPVRYDLLVDFDAKRVVSIRTSDVPLARWKGRDYSSADHLTSSSYISLLAGEEAVVSWNRLPNFTDFTVWAFNKQLFKESAQDFQEQMQFSACSYPKATVLAGWQAIQPYKGPGSHADTDSQQDDDGEDDDDGYDDEDDDEVSDEDSDKNDEDDGQ